MPKDFQKKIWAAMADKVPEIDRFIAVSHYYAGVMTAKIGIPAGKISVVYPGTDFSGFRPATPDPRHPTIGYLSRLTASLGMEVLVEAFLKLKHANRIPGLRLRLTGGRTSNDKAFIARQLAKIKAAGCAADVEIIDAFDPASRARFFETLSVLSVPVPQGEAFGAYLIEALACGVPVVQPQVGAFPEIISTTGGGVIYDPNDSTELADALASLLLHPDRAKALGEVGRRQVLQAFSIDKTAEELLAIYRQ
jgi:glycosyltransferase involved in cell wall biosynthesis